ncbi:hypothetical protein ES708_14628 [subsurface metagenome]
MWKKKLPKLPPSRWLGIGGLALILAVLMFGLWEKFGSP